MSGTIIETRRWLLAQGAAIHDEWEKRLRTQAQPGARQSPVSPYDKPNGYMKREVYRLVRSCLSRNAIDILQALVTEDDSLLRPTTYNDQDPFYWGFIFVCGMDKRISRQNRWRFANELLYAHKHNVPPKLLVGFIYQIGKSDGLRDRLLGDEMEEWYNDAAEKTKRAPPSKKEAAENEKKRNRISRIVED